MRSGIYRIRNIVNDKCYIGSAAYFASRKGVHFHNLRHNKHCNNHLQRAFNKYGEDSFVFEILCVCLPEDLISLEQHYIDTYIPEYNICRIAGNTLGVVCSEETRKKISIAHTGKKLSQEHKEKVVTALRNIVRTKNHYKHAFKPIYKLCPESLEILEEFESIMDASVKLNVDHSSIAKAAKGKLYKVGGYAWSHKENYDVQTIRFNIENTFGYKPIEQYNKDMVLLKTYKNLTEASQELEVSIQAVHNCVYGKSKSCCGFILKYKNNNNGHFKI